MEPVVDHARIDALRQRLSDDPSSIAFAQLAEELRRIGEFEDAVDICRAGLARHPMYLSARVTLGRALAGLGRLDAARTELEAVLAQAPHHLTAARAWTELLPHTSPPAGSGQAAIAASQAGVLTDLECWLDRLLADRAARALPAEGPA